jgi:Zinc-binding dehydrogenase
VVRGARVTGTASPANRALIESGRFSLPVAQAFPLAEVAEAHRVSEDGHPRGKLMLLVLPGLGPAILPTVTDGAVIRVTGDDANGQGSRSQRAA